MREYVCVSSYPGWNVPSQTFKLVQTAGFDRWKDIMPNNHEKLQSSVRTAVRCRWQSLTTESTCAACLVSRQACIDELRVADVRELFDKMDILLTPSAIRWRRLIWAREVFVRCVYCRTRG